MNLKDGKGRRERHGLKASRATLGIVRARDVFVPRAVPVAVAGLWLAELARAHADEFLEPVPLENSQQVLVAFGGHETCPRPVLGGLAWRVRWPRRGWRARVCCPAAVPRRGVLSLRVYRAVVLVSGPGSLRTGVHGRD